MERAQQELVPGLTRGAVAIWIAFLLLLGVFLGMSLSWCARKVQHWGNGAPGRKRRTEDDRWR